MATPAKEKKEKSLKDLLNDLDKDRKASGCTLGDAELAFIVKLVKASA